MLSWSRTEPYEKLYQLFVQPSGSLQLVVYLCCLWDDTTKDPLLPYSEGKDGNVLFNITPNTFYRYMLLNIRLRTTQIMEGSLLPSFVLISHTPDSTYHSFYHIRWVHQTFIVKKNKPFSCNSSFTNYHFGL